MFVLFRRRCSVTSKLNSGINVEEQLAVIIFIGVALFALLRDRLFSFVDHTNLFLDKVLDSVIATSLFLMTAKGILIALAVFSPFILYVMYGFSNALSAKLRKERFDAQRLQEQERTIKQLLGTNLEELDIHKIGRYITKIGRELHSIRRTKFEVYEKALSVNLEKAQRIYELRTHESKINAFSHREKMYRELLDILERRRQRYNREEETEKREIMYELDAQDTNVFYKEELKDEEIEVLKEEGYKQVNEYDIFSQSVRTFLVKSPLNHSSSHTFLVWSVKKLVEYIKGTERVEDHITRDADITFRYKKKVYALEIETGNLLSKKVQLKAKVAMLNRKYGKRWMFVVSNKELLSQYRKWGPSTQRTEVEKVLEKWLK